MKRAIKFRAFDTVENKWLFGYKKLGGFSLLGETVLLGQLPGVTLDRLNDLSIEQFTGLIDKNGKEIYEGDIIKWCQIETEWQTHTGDNIPNGSYTEPCGILSKWRTAQVYFNAPSFTTSHPDEELDFVCPLNPYNSIGYDREAIEQICFPDFPNSKVDDKELWEDGCLLMVDDLKIEADNVEAFLKAINGIEVIGNAHENPELLK